MSENRMELDLQGYQEAVGPAQTAFDAHPRVRAAKFVFDAVVKAHDALNELCDAVDWFYLNDPEIKEAREALDAVKKAAAEKDPMRHDLSGI